MCAACFTVAQVIPLTAGVARAQLVSRRRRKAAAAVVAEAEEVLERSSEGSDAGHRPPDVSAART